MDRLKIAIIIDDFYPSSGGIARSTQTQIDELVNLGHHVTLISPKISLEAPSNCEFIPLNSFHIPGSPPHMCILRYDKKVAETISNGHAFDLVHSQTERGALILAARISKMQKIPHVHTFHANLAGTHETDPLMSFWGSMAYLIAIRPLITLTSAKKIKGKISTPPRHSDALSIMSRLDWQSLAIIASRVDAFSAPANFMVKRIAQCLPKLQHTSEVIPTGVSRLFQNAIQNKIDHTDYKNNSKIHFLSVCRLSKEKRVDVVIHAFIRANIANSQLSIVGSGAELKKLKKLAKDHTNIIFHHHINDIDDLAMLYLSADVFIIASYRFDTQAITIAEAVAAGLPLIYCDDRLDIGVSPSNSILTSSPRASDLADAMKKIATDDSLRRDLSNHSQKIAPTLTSSNMAERYVSLYKSIIMNTPKADR